MAPISPIIIEIGPESKELLRLFIEAVDRLRQAHPLREVGWSGTLGEPTNQPSEGSSASGDYPQAEYVEAPHRPATLRTGDAGKCAHSSRRHAGTADGREHWRCDFCDDVEIKAVTK